MFVNFTFKINYFLRNMKFSKIEIIQEKIKCIIADKIFTNKFSRLEGSLEKLGEGRERK